MNTQTFHQNLPKNSQPKPNRKWIFFLTPVLVVLSGLFFISYALRSAKPTSQLNPDVERFFQDKAVDSDLVILGEVQSIEVKEDDQSNHLFSYITVEPTEFIQGRPRQSVIIRQIGGRKEGLSTFIAGGIVPSWQEHEEVLLFLRRQSEKTDYYTSGAEGKFLATRLSNGEEVFMVSPAIRNLDVIDDTFPKSFYLEHSFLPKEAVLTYVRHTAKEFVPRTRRLIRSLDQPQ